MATEEQLDAALLDVRKAYRLIYLYQRRMLDLCSEIAGAFEIDLNVYQWSSSHYEAPPRRGTNPLSRSAWDFLPLYDFCVLYLPEGVHYQEHKPDDWMLAVRVAADSGYAQVGSAEPDPRDFKGVASCEGTVKLYIYYCSQAFEANWYHGVYNINDFPRDYGEGAFENGVRTFGMKFSLSEMGDAKAVESCVDRFRQALREVFPARTEW